MIPYEKEPALAEQVKSSATIALEAAKQAMEVLPEEVGEVTVEYQGVKITLKRPPNGQGWG